ncbi:hypothetical protein [Metabacillus halosaccharovorans]|uniref:hypothetical protein n=1 Tax=Metabacillus halosaccharovorans TaxID=930124 RepID=UPI001C1F9317|nr:hypothetical protein [Metabacillus halosaccharovorans]MBU7592251.1 hypothetical protein [Metabacillus halosaccharovorans]
MKKNIIKILMILIIFTGGFFSGILYQNNSEKETNVPKEVTKAPKSEKKTYFKGNTSISRRKEKSINWLCAGL